jgi:hypothetical protein
MTPFHPDTDLKVPVLDFNRFGGQLYGSPAHAAGWFRDELARFTYKPGYTMAISNALFGLCLSVTMKCHDTYHPERLIDVGKSTPLHFIRAGNEDDFARFVAHELQELEVHESREWFKRDGVIFDNPHA